MTSVPLDFKRGLDVIGTDPDALALLRPAPNVRDFGAVGDGVNDDTNAFNAAIAAGVRSITVDEVPGSFYKVTQQIPLGSNFVIRAGKGRPKIKMLSTTTSRVFTMAGTRSGISGLEFDGTGGIQNDATIVISGGATDNFVDDNVFTSPASASTGAIVISGATTKRNRISNNYLNGATGTGIGITGGGENEILFNRLRGGGSFGIRLGEAAYRNLVHGNSSITSVLESIVTYFDCSQNRIIGNHCELAGDNGISISGFMNTVQGNVCYKNTGSGVGVWGSRNVIANNVLVSNNQGNNSYSSGVWLHSMYGGTGSFNSVSGNICDDDQAVATQSYGVRAHSNGYIAWAQGRTITAGDGNTEWTTNGLNIYRATNSGVTGATAPVHTSGTVSDGAVSWTYIGSFVTNVRPEYNVISGNSVKGAKTGPYSDASNWADNVLVAAQSGVPSFGVFTTNADAPVTGYVTVKDAAGNTRKLATIA